MAKLVKAHVNINESISEIVLDKKSRRRKRLSDLFPDLKLECDREIYHLANTRLTRLVSN